jgi:uncharacterized damage-inducible protein DinB
MTTLVDALRYQVDYSAWATGRLLNSAAALSSVELEHDFGTADKSVAGTLIHVFRSERVWLRRIVSSEAIPAHHPESDTWRVVVEQWPALHQQWRDWMQTVTAESLSTAYEYIDSKGTPRRSALWAIVLHVVNHGTHHRGQVSGFLRALGKIPPSLDAIGYARERDI